MIDTLIFDFGGVLVDLQPEVSLRRFRDLGVTDIDEMLNPYRQRGVFHDLEMGLVTRSEFVDMLNEHSGTCLTESQVEEAILLFLRGVPRYKFDFLRQLRIDKKVYILSNTNPFIMDYAHSDQFLPGSGSDVSDYTDYLYASCEMHAMKPDPEIFERMIEHSGMIPAHSLFIDDSEANVQAARAVGLNALLVENGTDWRPLLQSCIG